MRSRIFSIFRKEFIHISRDYRTLVIVVAMPMLMLFLYGFALNMEIQNIDLLVADKNGSPESRDLIRQFSGSDYFTVIPYTGPLSAIERIFEYRDAHAVLIIPQDYAEKLQRRLLPDVQVIVDATDSNKAQMIRNYVNIIIQTRNVENGLTPPFDIKPTIWYNPSLKSSYFFVPGLSALILIMISALLTSIAIVREKETGTMEQILVSPVRPVEIIIGKVVPYMFLAFLDLVIILVVARFVYKVPVVGNLGFLLVSCLIFILVALSLGLLISTKAQTQQVAMMMALVATLLPTVMLSGFIFPLSSLPTPLWLLSHIVPASYFMVVIRGIMLKGNVLKQLFPQIATLVAFSVVLLTISIKKFKTTIET